MMMIKKEKVDKIVKIKEDMSDIPRVPPIWEFFW